MAVINLSDYQIDAVNRMHNGCILNGGVGAGKSRTAITYYYVQNGGEINTGQSYVKMKNPCDLYIITTAQKRDKMEWEDEMRYFLLSTNPEVNYYKNKIVVDSWNNIKKYMDVKDAFFIFDEQRLVGYGEWVHAFFKIAKQNKWILLSATPGDKWLDYMPVFIANGFYRNKTDFCNQHVIWDPFVSFQRPKGYINEGKLLKLKRYVLVNMNYQRPTVPHKAFIICDYNKHDYEIASKDRWNIFEQKPIENASEFCAVLRRIVNSSPDKQLKLLDLVEKHPKVIIFYNYDYELEILRNLFRDTPYQVGEWNGHVHSKIPEGDKWVYLVQYTAGAEGWNCITTDTIVFYSQNYSYKIMVQAAGRIDRRNTPFKDLYYYHFKTQSKIDGAIQSTLNKKKKFSEKGFAPVFEKKEEPKVVSTPPKNWIDECCEIYNSWEHPPQCFNIPKEEQENE